MADGSGGKANTITSKVVLVTPDLAAAWLAKRHAQQRPVALARVRSIANDITAGNWKLTHQGIAFDAGGFLIDGQHRLEAVVLAGVAVQMMVFRNEGATLHDPIDRGATRAVGFVAGMSNRRAAMLAALCRLTRGIVKVTTTPVTVAETVATADAFAGELAALDEAKAWEGSAAGLLAGAAYVMAIDKTATLEFLRQCKLGEMIHRGDPAFAWRAWNERRGRLSTMQAALAAINCLRHHIQGAEYKNVFIAEQGYRAATSRRRAMKLPHTPGTDAVIGISWPLQDKDRPVE